MCGIVAICDFQGRPVNNGIMQQFDLQRHRGTDGFGLFDGDKMNIVKATKENKILKWLVKYNSSMIVFHHRYPTSTANVKRAAHPFSTGNYFGNTSYVLVHNGVIRNADELFEDHQELGIEYKTMLDDLTYNDSEALLWDFALYMEGKQKEMKSIGDMAFICMKLVDNKIERMYFYRNLGRPLNMLKSKEGIMLSSEGAGEEVEDSVLHNWNYKLKRLTKKPLNVWRWKTQVPSSSTGDSYYPYSDRNYDPYDEYGGGGTYGYDSFGNWVGSNGGYNWKGEEKPGRDEDTAYQNWWASKDAVAAGAVLGTQLREKYKHFFNKDGSVKGAPPLVERSDKSQQTMDFVETETGIYVPRNERYPSGEEVSTEMLAYLASVRGHFEQAHWAIEMDYEDLENKNQTEETIRKKLLLDLVLQRLDGDPEYEDEESVSSTWSELWEAHKLLTV